MMSRSIAWTASLLIATAAVVLAPQASAQGYNQQQQALCSGDAFRLCSAEIPDVDRVTACMVRQRASLSPGCRSLFRADPVARRSNMLSRATKARRVRKPRRAR